jgi:hypothetical protein
MNEPIDGGKRQARHTRGPAMTHHKTLMLLAFLAATIVSQSANAGMSGTSARVEQQSAKETQAAIQAPAAKPVVQGPVRPAPARRDQAPQPTGGNFDGVWATRASPGCGLAEHGAVQISRGRIAGQGLSGSVDANGNVRTVARGGGLSVSSTGRIGPTTGSGTYTVSNGCTGTWTAQKS